MVSGTQLCTKPRAAVPVQTALRRAAGRSGEVAAGEGAAGASAPKGRCRVGREVTRPGPSPDPDKEISTIRLFR
jgi:hypothetical protein